MRIFLSLVFTSILLFVKGQTNCNPTLPPSAIYYPNSTQSPTVNVGYEYLCGPNTIVYDTVSNGCHFVYVNSGCSFIFKSFFSCAGASEIWVKNTGTVTLLPGGAPLQINYEVGATINNPSSVPVSSTSCSVILFPTVNCTPTGLGENGIKNEGFDVFPNPANDILNIRFNIGGQSKSACFFIYNSIGELVLEDKIIITDNKSTIATGDLKNGYYFLALKTENTTLNTRFVISGF